jgi:hypothetical protein
LIVGIRNLSSKQFGVVTGSPEWAEENIGIIGVSTVRDLLQIANGIDHLGIDYPPLAVTERTWERI